MTVIIATMGNSTKQQSAALADTIKRWGQELGFQQVAIAGIDLGEAEVQFEAWITEGFHGEMAYMTRHGRKRTRPSVLEPGTLSVISARMDYLPEPQVQALKILEDPSSGYISRYALGRDYHKLLRKRLQQLADRIAKVVGPFGHRVFVDSAPVLEKPLGAAAGLGWVGKHTNLLNRDGGSWFFLGEIYTDLPLPPDTPVTPHCGSCRACIDICPTEAIIAPYHLDARRCISYLTIELHGPIPEPLRPYIGNRIYGCDDCQLICPWNRFARTTDEKDFQPRHGMETAKLVELFAWDETQFLRLTEGSAIRRLGHERWLRNIAVALGNAPSTPEVLAALAARTDDASPLIREHVRWALARHGQ